LIIQQSRAAKRRIGRFVKRGTRNKGERNAKGKAEICENTAQIAHAAEQEDTSALSEESPLFI
jgi:hypothetical protein